MRALQTRVPVRHCAPQAGNVLMERTVLISSVSACRIIWETNAISVSLTSLMQLKKVVLVAVTC